MLRKNWPVVVPALLIAVFAIFAVRAQSGSGGTANVERVDVVAAYPHDPRAFSQGLIVEGEILYEGTGQYGASTQRKVDLKSGKVLQSAPVDSRFFGEGIATYKDRIYQLTWKENTCLVYDKKSFRLLGSFRYTKQGWGLACDGEFMYMSDGTATLRVIDPETFKVVRKLVVRNGRRQQDNLNELEFVEGEIWANVWYKDHIARINPESGAIEGWIDCSNVYPARQRPDREHVLNGIAYDSESKRIFVTGKNWPKLYEIKVK